MYIINFKTVHYKLIASGNIIHSIFNYELMRPVSNLRLIIKYEQIHKNHEIFEKTRSINAIKFNSFQRKPVNTPN